MIINTIFALPDNFIASTTAIIGQLAQDLGDYITLIIGVMLAMAVIGFLVSIFIHRD